MKDFDFDKLKYRRPHFFIEDEIERFIGVDSESYTTGEPFLICTSTGAVLSPRDFPRAFFAAKYRGADFVAYNLKYDSGSLIYKLPVPVKRQLWTDNRAVYGDYTLSYIPHKFLSVKYGRRVINFWDVAQYYEMSLDAAAKKYLGEGKGEIETKRFTPEYVRENRDRIIQYCVRDAVLTAKLAVYLKDKLNGFNVEVTRLYSSAYLSFTYFKDHSRIVDVWRFWDKCRDVLRYACEAYQGGKFEVYKRGTFAGHEYDIVSAYPYEIANLRDVSRSRVVKSRRPVPGAMYAFIRCHLTFNKYIPHPAGVQINGINIYPMGHFWKTVTLNEYNYLLEKGVDVDILDGYWIVPRRESHPYRNTVLELFKMKDYYKNRDAGMYHVSKKMLNGFYGKFLQVIEKDGFYKAGAGWNPIYGAVITANTRIRMCDLQAMTGDDCLAVHTDSIITASPLPGPMLSKGLGGLTLECSGPGLVVMCGMYDMADKCAYRGIEFKYESWREVLSEYKNFAVLTFPQIRVVSWRQAAAWDLFDKINLFEDYPKNIDLNADRKRIWPRKVKAGDLLTGLDGSIPRVYNQTENPFTRAA